MDGQEPQTSKHTAIGGEARSIVLRHPEIAAAIIGVVGLVAGAVIGGVFSDGPLAHAIARSVGYDSESVGSSAQAHEQIVKAEETVREMAHNPTGATATPEELEQTRKDLATIQLALADSRNRIQGLEKWLRCYVGNEFDSKWDEFQRNGGNCQ